MGVTGDVVVEVWGSSTTMGMSGDVVVEVWGSSTTVGVTGDAAVGAAWEGLGLAELETSIAPVVVLGIWVVRLGVVASSINRSLPDPDPEPDPDPDSDPDPSSSWLKTAVALGGAAVTRCRCGHVR